MDKRAVQKALDEARALVAELEAYDGTTQQHHALLRRSDQVRTAIEEPYDKTMRWIETMSSAAALSFLLRVGALDKIPQQTSISAVQLASICNVDSSALSRALRVLVADGIFRQTGNDEYAHNEMSDAFRFGRLGGFVTMWTDFMKAWVVLPDYFKSHEPGDVYDTKKSPFAFAAGHEGKTYYEVLALDPEQRGIWDKVLQDMESGFFPISDMFPFQKLEEQVKAELERPYIVDVGGGRGQALLGIRKHFGGDFGGELILQDLPVVIESLRPEDIPGIKPMVYDVFTPQPIKGAHVYFMRRLLHDFYDPQVATLLRNTASAMAMTSRLIICDMLVPDRVKTGGSKTLYWLDFCLLMIGGKERSKAEFDNVLAQAGLELVDIYPSKEDNIVMLETRLLQGT